MQLKQACEELYQQMVSEIYQCRQLELPACSRVAYCFKTCLQTWNNLQQMAKTHQFISEDEEIWFFKIMKPKFTALLEYYTLVYHAELNLTALKDDELTAFWEKESERPTKFYHEHSDFCHYYKSGSTNKDHIYFLRSNISRHLANVSRVYDTDPDLITSHDHLASSLLAFDMYHTYILQHNSVIDL